MAQTRLALASLFLVPFLVPLLASPARAKESELATIEVGDRSRNTSPNSVVEMSDLKSRSPETLADVLRLVPGIEVIRQGGVGQTTSVFIRGARSEDTLVLIDDTEANDAIAPSSGFDFSSISAENIERIEVYRGPQSVRFGAGALGGVIRIVTKEGRGLPRFHYKASGASYKTYRGTLGHSGALENFRYMVAVDQLVTEGFSAADDPAGENEADGADIRSASTKLSWVPDESSRYELSIRHVHAKTEIDSHGGQGGDDPNNNTQARQTIIAASTAHRLLTNQLGVSIGLHRAQVERDGQNFPDSRNPVNSTDHFVSTNHKISSEIDWTHGVHTFRTTVSFREEIGESNSDFAGVISRIPQVRQSVYGVGFFYLYDNENLFWDLGTRIDESSQVGRVLGQRLEIGYRFFEKRLRASLTYGTGYKLPSLYQLHSAYGEPTLLHENSSSIDGTLQWTPTKNLIFAATVFENRYRDLIDFDLISNHYHNVARAKSQGAEFELSSEIADGVSLGGNYVVLTSKDEASGLKLLRRPEQSWGLSLTYAQASWTFTSQIRTRGVRDDVDPNTFQRLTLPEYSNVAFHCRYSASEAINVHLSLENALDSQYQEVAGYNIAGRTFQLSFSGEF